MTKIFKALNGRVIKYSLGIIFLSMILVLVPLTVDFSSVSQAQAGTWWDKASEGGLKEVGNAYGVKGEPSSYYDIRLIIARIVRSVLELMGFIFLIIIIVAGFRWMLAGGDEEKVTTAKRQLTNGILGFALVMVSLTIATYIFYYLQYATTGIFPITWSTFF
jgi:hypothetical protein